MPLPQFIDYTAKIIGYTVLVLLPLVCGVSLFFSIAKRARKKVDIDMDNYSHKPVVEEHEKGFSDNDFVDFKVKKNLEYSSN